MNAHRKVVRSLLLPGERRIHFTKESNHRRRKILATVSDFDMTVQLYSRPRDDAESRRACLEAVVQAAAESAERVVIERDESTLAADRRVLYDAVRKNDCVHTLRYDLLAPHDDPMLWIPDAIAWCWSKGGRWRESVSPMCSLTKLPLDTRNPAHQPSGWLPGPLQRRYCTLHNPV